VRRNAASTDDSFDSYLLEKATELQRRTNTGDLKKNCISSEESLDAQIKGALLFTGL
jgi:hypothetical protein